MKKHMRRNYQELKQVGALTIEDSSLHQLNLMKEWSSKQSDMMESLKTELNDQFKTNMYETMLMMQQMETQPPPLVATTDSESNTSDSLNSMTSASTVSSLLSGMKLLQQEIKELKESQSKQVIDKSINPRTGKKWKRYCWSCGCCPHSGRFCKNKLPGHRDEATFNNRMGGSNKFCRPIQE